MAFAFAQLLSAAHAETHHDLHVHHDHHAHHDDHHHHHDHIHLGSHEEHGNQGDPREACLICCLATSDDDGDAFSVTNFKTIENSSKPIRVVFAPQISKPHSSAAVFARGPPNT